MVDSDLQFIIITGMSGAGKSQAANALEDIGYYCIDNIPPMLIPAIVDIAKRGEGNLSKVAVITDLRGRKMFDEVDEAIENLKNRGISAKIVFIDASDNEIIRRYKENRRMHPLCSEFSIPITEAIATERKRLDSLKQKSDYIIDTTLISSNQLKQRVLDIFSVGKDSSMKIQCMSFGFKYGSCGDADLVFDVRCLPNPFYIDSLRNLTGIQKPVSDYVMSFPQSLEYVAKLINLLNFSVPLYRNEGKSQLVIAVGCTGGKHRSVTIAEIIYNDLANNGYNVSVNHRDINK